jgi:outer membrane protein TolC
MAKSQRAVMAAHTSVANGLGRLFALSRLAAAVIVLLPQAACLVGPDFEKPLAPVAEKFLKAAGPALADSHDYQDWWKSFDDHVLDRLIEIAYAQNLTLLSAGSRVIEARAALGVAIGEFYPQSQQGVGGIGYSGQSRTDPLSSPLAPRYFWRDNLGAKVVWELDLWGKFRRGVESADAAYLASIATYDDVLVTVT